MPLSTLMFILLPRLSLSISLHFPITFPVQSALPDPLSASLNSPVHFPVRSALRFPHPTRKTRKSTPPTPSLHSTLQYILHCAPHSVLYLSHLFIHLPVHFPRPSPLRSRSPFHSNFRFTLGISPRHSPLHSDFTAHSTQHSTLHFSPHSPLAPVRSTRLHSVARLAIPRGLIPVTLA